MMPERLEAGRGWEAEREALKELRKLERDGGLARRAPKSSRLIEGWNVEARNKKPGK